MKRMLPLLLALSLLLTGCGSLFDGSYVSVKPHEVPNFDQAAQQVKISTYNNLVSALRQMLFRGVRQAVFSVEGYPEEELQADLDKVDEELKEDPVVSYMTADLTLNLNTDDDSPILEVGISYARSPAELEQLQVVPDMLVADEVLCGALSSMDTGLLMLIEDYDSADFQVLAENYAMRNPDLVMELPQILVNIYPETGNRRIAEISFRYRTNRTMLRSMQQEVRPIFDAGVAYVSHITSQEKQYAQLYAFLKDRFEYKLETSLTPAYSLLCHGVGDSRAFASVYAALCRETGIFCRVVAGTYHGEVRFWNMIYLDGVYYHVDLLQPDYMIRTDAEMTDYVWDYWAYSHEGVETK